ncbi:MAG TPA: c-type cytochrome [Burkholderiales bacterium]|nr:c-type cytochrome [Burkholderiales bacterium]
MSKLAIAATLSLLLAGCGEKESAPKPVLTEPAQIDRSAGRAVADANCRACHGLDGKGVAPGIPHLAAQRERYLRASLQEYKEGKRSHAALKEMATRLSDAETRNVLAYYATLPAVGGAPATDIRLSSSYQQGKALAAACAKCHGEDGNSTTPGTPSLAGQQPHYLVNAVREYHQGERKTAPMREILRETSRTDLEKLALYFASQTPARRPAPPYGDPASGKPLSAMCGGCHGASGVSADAATPSLAGQDPQYLLNAIKAYRTTRQHWGMQRYVAGLGDREAEHLAAYYATQQPQAADTIPASAHELATKCNRCHDTDDNPSVAMPKIKGQDRDYLVMALRAYRDDRRASSTMHRMSSVYSNAIIEDIASYYSTQPPQ